MLNLPNSFYFKVMVNGVNGDLVFEEVTGLDVKMNAEEITEGNENLFTHKLPGQGKFSNLILKRGFLKRSTALRMWLQQSLEHFEFTSMPVIISLVSTDEKALASWQLHHAYPVALKTSDTPYEYGTLWIETLELACNYFERIT